MDCVTDTHALVWYLYAMPELSANAKNFMDNAAASGGFIFVPTISFVEITYLAEKGRLGANVLPRINLKILRQLAAGLPIRNMGVQREQCSLWSRAGSIPRPRSKRVAR